MEQRSNGRRRVTHLTLGALFSLMCATSAQAQDGGKTDLEVQRVSVVLSAIGPALQCRDWVKKRAAACRLAISTPDEPLAPVLCENQYKTYAYNCEHLLFAALHKAAADNANDGALVSKLQEMGRERSFPEFLHDGRRFSGEKFLSCMESEFSSSFLAETRKACRDAWEDDEAGASQCAADKAGLYYRRAMKCGGDAVLAQPNKSKAGGAKKPSH